MGGYIAEILVYDASLSLEQRQEVLSYLNEKYSDLTSHSSHTYVVKNLPEEEIYTISDLS